MSRCIYGKSIMCFCIGKFIWRTCRCQVHLDSSNATFPMLQCVKSIKVRMINWGGKTVHRMHLNSTRYTSKSLVCKAIIFRLEINNGDWSKAHYPVIMLIMEHTYPSAPTLHRFSIRQTMVLCMQSQLFHEMTTKREIKHTLYQVN